MKKTVSYSKSQLLDDLGRLALMVLASVIMAVNLKELCPSRGLVPGGFNGLTLLIQRVALRFWGLSVPFSAINFLLNAVPAVISFKLIGKRFTLFSCVVILCTSLLTDLIPPMPITDDVLLICIFGGLINGFAISLCLRGRATSGGTDFISIALSQQYDVDAWNYIFMGNVVMLAVSGALFGWDQGPVFHPLSVCLHPGDQAAGPQRPRATSSSSPVGRPPRRSGSRSGTPTTAPRCSRAPASMTVRSG